jgi:hypothetical protein
LGRRCAPGGNAARLRRRCRSGGAASPYLVAGNAFVIAAATGAITTATALDFETTPSYTLTVEVSNGPDSDTATVTVDVTDVFEAPTHKHATANRMPPRPEPFSPCV